jgi:hypothetical protein
LITMLLLTQRKKWRRQRRRYSDFITTTTIHQPDYHHQMPLWKDYWDSLENVEEAVASTAAKNVVYSTERGDISGVGAGSGANNVAVRRLISGYRKGAAHWLISSKNDDVHKGGDGQNNQSSSVSPFPKNCFPLHGQLMCFSPVILLPSICYFRPRRGHKSNSFAG